MMDALTQCSRAATRRHGTTEGRPAVTHVVPTGDAEDGYDSILRGEWLTEKRDPEAKLADGEAANGNGWSEAVLT